MSVAFILEDGLLRWGEQTAELTPQQAAILGVLVKRQPHWLMVERLAAAIWPAREPQDCSGSIRVPITMIRRKIKGWPITIESRWGYGWRLVGEIEVM